MDSFSGRLKKILEQYNLSASQFAQKMEIPKSRVSHLLSGRNKPGFDFLVKLSEVFPELNLKWILTGSGEMISSPTLSDSKNSGETDVFVSAGKTPGQTENEIIELYKIYDDGTFEVLKRKKRS